jgi:hypothetical protein
MEACNAGTDNTCPFTPGVGVSGVYFSFDSGTTWTQPTYTGLTARDCLGTVGASDPRARPTAGRSGRSRATRRTDSPPTATRRRVRAAAGPGGFSWANGSRLYYANLTANVGATRSEQAFKGFEAIAVSRTDNPQAAAANDASAWMAPVLDQQAVEHDLLRQGTGLGRQRLVEPVLRHVVRVLGVVPRPGEGQRGARRRWWSRSRTTAATAGHSTRSRRRPTTASAIRSTGARSAPTAVGAYVLGVGTSVTGGKQPFEFMSKSTDGGTSWSRPQAVAGPVQQPGR